jgi:cob(I)alamin adenosyltransferase
LNSWLGVVRVASPVVVALDGRPALDAGFVMRLQRNVVSLSANVAGYGEFPHGADFVPLLEAEMERLSPLSVESFAFCVPDGFVHVARAVCRRAERSLVRYASSHSGVPFLNRLSSYLFALASTMVQS